MLVIVEILFVANICVLYVFVHGPFSDIRTYIYIKIPNNYTTLFRLLIFNMRRRLGRVEKTVIEQVER